MEATQEREFDALNAEYLAKNMALARTSGLFHPTLTLLTGLGTVVVVWVGGSGAIRGEISAGEFVAFSFYLAMLTWPMIALGWVTNLFERGMAALGRIDAIMRAEPAVRASADRSGQTGCMARSIPRRQLPLPGQRPGRAQTFLPYPRRQDRRARGADRCRQVDRRGAVDPAVRPTAGEILLDSVPLTRLDRRGPCGHWRRPKEPFVFSETIADNIALGPAREALTAVSPRPSGVATGRTLAVLPNGLETPRGAASTSPAGNVSGVARPRSCATRASFWTTR